MHRTITKPSTVNPDLRQCAAGRSRCSARFVGVFSTRFRRPSRYYHASSYHHRAPLHDWLPPPKRPHSDGHSLQARPCTPSWTCTFGHVRAALRQHEAEMPHAAGRPAYHVS
eukprot:976252-Prorocentrum_minimum.AAC.6